MIQMNLFTKQRLSHRHRKHAYGTKEDTGVWGEVSQEFGVSTHALLYVHQVAQGAAV